MITFDRLIGPHADVKELEFISALQQTEAWKLRADGTLKAIDIVYYLASRHGIRTNEEVVREKIVIDLCGSLFGQDSVDLCQMVALLIIPSMRRLREARDNAVKKQSISSDFDSLFKLVVNEARAIDKNSVINSSPEDTVSEDDDEKVLLTPKLLDKMLDNLGEDDIGPQDIAEMIEAVKRCSKNNNKENMTEAGAVVLDKYTFLNVLTDDVSLYCPQWEDMDTTHYEDSKKGIQNNETSGDGEYEILLLQNGEVVPKDDPSKANKTLFQYVKGLFFDQSTPNKTLFKIKPTASFVDMTSDTYRSPVLMILLWTCLVILFHFEFLDLVMRDNWKKDICDHPYTPLCLIGVAIVKWLFICLVLFYSGMSFVILGSAGNSTYNPRRTSEKICLSILVLLSIWFILNYCLSEYIIELGFQYMLFGMGENGNDDDAAGKLSSSLLVLLGIFLLGERLVRLIQIWFSGPLPYITGGTMALEKSIKQAASYKVEKMIRNALLMHYKPCEKADDLPSTLFAATVAVHEDRTKHSPMLRAFLNYEAMVDTTERVGGILWTWKRIIDQTLFHKEGIWLHARLISSNLAQIIALLFHIITIAGVVTMQKEIYENGWVRDLLWTANDDYAEAIANAAVNVSKNGDNLSNVTQTMNSIFINVNNIMSLSSAAVEDPFYYAVQTAGGQQQAMDINGINNIFSASNDILNQHGNYTTEIATALNNTIGMISNAKTNNMTISSASSNNSTNSSYIVGPVYYIHTGEQTVSIGDVLDSIGVSKDVLHDILNAFVSQYGFDNINTSSLLSEANYQYSFNGYFLELSTQNMWFKSTNGNPAIYLNRTSYVPIPLSGNFYYNYDNESFFYEQLPLQVTSDAFKQIIPPWQLDLSLSIGGILSILSCIIIILVYIPSAVSTIMSFRCGLMTSLRDPSFLDFRVAKDQCRILLGSTFWGCILTGWFTFIVFSLVVFFFVWKGTRNTAILIIAQITGITITFLIKFLVLLCARRSWSSGGFYFRKPFFSNIFGIFLEFWNLALTIGFMTVRSLNFLLVVIVYIGRIDTPMLAPGACNFGPLKLDINPSIFQKDLLMHDAHRHPYIERLGLLYMMKLRHGEQFGNRIGTYWRMLLVLTLMPWMQNYRTWAYLNVQHEDFGDETDGNEDTIHSGTVNSRKMMKINKSRDLMMQSSRRIMQSSRRIMESTKDLEAENRMLREKLKELGEPLEDLGPESADFEGWEKEVETSEIYREEFIRSLQLYDVWQQVKSLEKRT